MLDREYSIARTLEGVDFNTAKNRITESLQGQGFGVLTEIDVQATFKKKLDKEFRPYLILGACNPGFAFEALSRELGVGLFMPCNVVVTLDDDGNAVIAAVDPRSMVAALGEVEGLDAAMAEVGAKITLAVENA